MKIGTIIKPNQKGQVVIPKEFRDELGINSDVALNLILRGGGIYIYPVEEVIGAVEEENSYLKILEKTKGTWKDEDWENLRSKKRKIELSASKRRKQKW